VLAVGSVTVAFDTAVVPFWRFRLLDPPAVLLEVPGAAGVELAARPGVAVAVRLSRCREKSRVSHKIGGTQPEEAQQNRVKSRANPNARRERNPNAHCQR